jgi:hypothetical protein
MPRFAINETPKNEPSNLITPRFKFDWEVNILHPEFEFEKFFAQKVSRTNIKIETEEIWGLGDVMYNPGRRTYTPIDITFVELENDSEYWQIYEFFKSLYGGGNNKYVKKNSDIKDMIIETIHFGSEGSTPTHYTYYGCFITDLKAEEFAYEGNDFSKFTITVRFDSYECER